MNSETKICQNCRQNFIVEPEDFEFYNKIKVPVPTFCPECRLQRRLIWRNEKTLYKRKCDAPGHFEDIIAQYAPELNTPVYDHVFWFSDLWDATQYGQEHDFSKPFFGQFKNLLNKVPRIALFDSKSVNSRYCNITVEHKNCYLVTAGWNNEDSLYSNRISYCRDTMDSYVSHKTEFSYENIFCKNSHKLFFSKYSENCNNSYFLYDCRNCSDCVGCTNLRNKQYYIFNKAHTKEEYLRKIEDMNLSDRRSLVDVADKFHEIYLKALHRYARLIQTTDVVGDNIEKSKNCYYCFDLAGEAENVSYANWGTYGLRESYDTGPGTGGNSELTYEGISIGVANSRCKFGVVIWYSQDTQYSFHCQSSRNLFGCVGLRGKEYCILNKQYTKKEYEKLVPQIIDHMNKMPYVDKQGRIYKYGEFFPPELSPFSYNEAVSQDYIPLTKREAEEYGFSWRDAQVKDYSITVKAEDLPNHVKNVDEAMILNAVIGCEHEGHCNEQCTKAFKIIKPELDFYRKMNLPLPRFCPNCRHYQRIKQRNPLKLWERQCECQGQTSQLKNQNQYQNTSKHFHETTPCPNTFQTSYSPDRPEIIYCEECYKQEVA